jgi:hypothetical protein
LEERHIGEHCGAEEYFGTTKYSENQDLKGMVIHSKPYIVKILNFTVDFDNKKILQIVFLFGF